MLRTSLALYAVGLGCGQSRGGRSALPAAGDAASNDASNEVSNPVGPDAGDAATVACDDTEDNILGPYWRDGAPVRSNLVEPGMKGTPFALAGQVRAEGCKLLLPSATLDFWQADAAGAYDDGIWPPPPEVFRLRGRVIADKDGRFSLATIIPGRYLNGTQYRPAHVHVIVQAPGYRKLTTQLYFAGDPFNDIDPYIKKSLIVPLADAGSGKSALFDFVLAPA